MIVECVHKWLSYRVKLVSSLYGHPWVRSKVTTCGRAHGWDAFAAQDRASDRTVFGGLMKIKAFQVTKYRSVEDSGRIDLLDNLTCIVGKNQSGKTALLRALFKFNPRLKNPYDLRREWPRGQRHLQSDDQVVCTVWFQLEPEEKEGLAGLTTETLNTDQVVVTKDYAGRFEVTFADQPDVFPDKLHPNAIDEACEKLRPPTSQPVGEGFQT